MGISWPQLLIVAVLVILIFGTKKLSSLGSDLGSSIKGFKKAIKDDDADKADTSATDADFTTKSIEDKIEGKPESVNKDDVKRHDKEQV
ncbi:twin-arginine translocase TatA/TatE family subunit [Siccibacter turicensis]|uniref:twin-arginine translocase TatA/TatE family subunit n=1 Tax=Siccibacter turicensis TaxID=357233 RepID=UPI003F57E613